MTASPSTASLRKQPRWAAPRPPSSGSPRRWHGAAIASPSPITAQLRSTIMASHGNGSTASRPTAPISISQTAATGCCGGEGRAGGPAAWVPGGVLWREPVAKPTPAEAMRGMRACLYRGDAGETFCASAGEAQAMGIPGVVQDIGSLREGIIDGVTGVVARDDSAFAQAAINLLTDDTLWQRQHAAALARQRGFGWGEAAIEFEKLLS